MDDAPPPRPARRGPYQKTAARREAIVGAARAAFGQRGYRAASLREVAELAGVPLSTLQHHFPVKEDLLLEVLRARDEAEPLGPGPDASADFVAHVLARASANEPLRGLIELYSVLLGEATTPGHPARDYFRDRFARLRRSWTAAFTALQREGRLHDGVDPASAATGLLALWDGAQLQWLLDPEAVDVVRLLADHLDRVVRPTASSSSAGSG